MAEEILLDYVLNRPYVSTKAEETDLKVLLEIKPSSEVSSAQTAAAPTHIVLVLDVSSSMRAREMDALKAAARAAVDHLRPGDFVSVIAFQSVAYEIVSGVRLEDSSTRAMLHKKIEVIDQYQGGGTDLEHALTKAEHALSVIPGANLVQKIVVFTDGQITGAADACLRRAQQISQRGYGIDAVGLGQEFDYKFMQRLVSYSSGFTEKIERPEEISAVFAKRVKNATHAVAQNVRLELTFTPQVRAKRGYRCSPEIAYMGKIRLPGDSRVISIPVGTLEKDIAYTYLVTLTVPQRPAGNIRVIKADLIYDIPSLGITQGRSTQSVIVTYTDDTQAINQIKGQPERVFDEVEISRLIEGLDLAMTRDQPQDAAMFFDTIAERYKELGDAAMSQHYVELKQKYAQSGKLSQEDMNYTRHKATQKRASSVQLVDASDLI